MAGVRVNITFDDAAVRAALTRLSRYAVNAQPAFDEIGARMVASTIGRFEREEGPDGAPWPKSARAREHGGQTLTDTGRLRSSITHSADRDSVVVGTNVKYAAIHQLGGRTRPHVIRPRHRRALFFPGARHPIAKINHPGSVFPARPFLGVSDGDRDVIVDAVTAHLAAAL